MAAVGVGAQRHLVADLVDEDDGAVALGRVLHELAQRLAHQPRLTAHLQTLYCVAGGGRVRTTKTARLTHDEDQGKGERAGVQL
jgi:hypothetical protein